jgi:hypothetical protein
MKLTATSTHNKPRALLFMVFLSLASGLLTPGAVFSDSTNNSQISESPADLSNATAMSESQAINLSPKDNASPSTYTKKNTLNEDSRGLSTFLLIGIIINIIMAATFTWWFLRQWRQTKK